MRQLLSRGRLMPSLLISSLRLSRDIGDTDAIIKRLRFIGISVIAVADNINTADDTTKISVTVKSLVNELYLDDLRKATKRGLDGQFLKGYATGGRTCGYLSEPVHGSSPSEPEDLKGDRNRSATGSR